MKKFALLGAVAALATAGGVFAAWSFSGDNIANPNATNEIGITVDPNKEALSNLGTLTIAENVSIKVEADNNTVNHNTIKATITGNVTINYTSHTDLEAESVKLSYSWDNGSGTIIDRPGEDVDVTYTMGAFDQEIMAPNGEGTYDTITKTVSMTFTGEIRTQAELTTLTKHFNDNKISLVVNASKVTA